MAPKKDKKIVLKHKKGVLHTGGGRFFYADQPVDVTAEELEQLLEDYPNDLEEVPTKKTGNRGHTPPPADQPVVPPEPKNEEPIPSDDKDDDTTTPTNDGTVPTTPPEGV